MTTNTEDTVKTVDATTEVIDASSDVSEKVTVEEFEISGDALVAKIRELIHQGNIRRIIIKNENGQNGLNGLFRSFPSHGSQIFSESKRHQKGKNE